MFDPAPSPIARLRKLLADARVVAGTLPPYAEAGTAVAELTLDLKVAVREREALDRKLAELAGVLRRSIEATSLGMVAESAYRVAQAIERLEALAGVEAGVREGVA